MRKLFLCASMVLIFLVVPGYAQETSGQGSQLENIVWLMTALEGTETEEIDINGIAILSPFIEMYDFGDTSVPQYSSKLSYYRDLIDSQGTGAKIIPTIAWSGANADIRLYCNAIAI